MALRLPPAFGALGPAASDEDLVIRSLFQAMEAPADTQFRHQLAWHYFQGDMYRWLRDQRGVAAEREKAGKHLELSAYFNPVREIVDVAVDKVFAMPVAADRVTGPVDARLNALWTRSRFEQLVRSYVRAGAAQGTVYLQVLDGPRSRIQVRRADELDVVHNPQTGQIIAARLSYEVYDPLGLESNPRQPGVATGKPTTYRYDFLMTGRAYVTFRDGQPWPFSDNPVGEDGFPLRQWPNIMGRVPVVEVRHSEDTDGSGVSAWEFLKETIDAANQIATFMANTVKQHVDPLIVIYGVKKADIEKSLLNGQTNVFYISAPDNPNGIPPKVDVVEWQGNVSDVTGFIGWIKDRLVDVAPELQLSRIQEQANPSGYSVALQSNRLVGHIEGQRANYFQKLIEADRLALWAEDLHTGALDPLAPSSFEVLADEEAYAHHIKAGPILPADIQQEVDLASKMLADGTIDRLEYLLRVGYSLPEARRILTRATAEKEENAARMLGMGQVGGERAALAGGDEGDDAA
jgi:hypothetical protein